MKDIKYRVPNRQIAELLCELGKKKFPKTYVPISFGFETIWFGIWSEPRHCGLAQRGSGVDLDDFYKEVSLEEMILALTKESFKPIEVKLNAENKAIVETDWIRVGCQTFTFEAVDALAEAVKKAREFNKNP